METTRDIIVMVIMLIVGFFGSPITQLFKNLLSKIFKTVIEDRWALLVSGVVAVLLALLEMFLSGQLTNVVITAANFPAFVTAVFTITQVYFNLLKKSETFLGSANLLAPPAPPQG